MRAAVLVAIASMAVANGGCAIYDAATGGGDDDDGGGQMITAGVFPNTPLTNVDLLLVVDNTSGMVERQNAFSIEFPNLINLLASIPGGLPSIHIGIVSTDMGVGNNTGITGCTQLGDGGHMRPGGTCMVTNSFISDIAQPNGTRQRNYTGQLVDAMSCMTRLGQGGCAFEQPLLSMRTSLQPGINTGFLREEAALAVVLFSNEDDCSADSAFFSPSNLSVGPFSSFRCFQSGVVCDQATTELGEHTGCHPMPAPSPMHTVETYVDFLRDVKPNRAVALAVVAGPREPVSVVPDPTMPSNASVDGSCTSSAGPSVPGVRLMGFADQLTATGATTTFESSCAASYQGAMLTIGRAVKNAMGVTRCLNGSLVDHDGHMPGVQPSCRVHDGMYDSPNTWTTVPSCDDASARPCWRAVESADCDYTPSHLALSVERDIPSSTQGVIVECDAFAGGGVTARE